MSGRRRRFGGIHALVVLVTVASLWLTGSRLRLSNDLTDLFPRGGEATMLTRFLRAFGGGDLAVFLIESDAPDDAAASADALAKELGTKASIARVFASAPPPRAVDATLAWAFAGPHARERLARALTPEGMRERLDGTRELLLAPGATDEGDFLARDPLRLSAIPFEERIELAAGVSTQAGAAFATNDGKARLVIAEPKGSAFEGDNAARFMTEARAAMNVATKPGVKIRATGGHAIAASTAEMLRGDMIFSGTLSSVLASVAFLLTFRRVRALFAVLPPLALGTAWTMGLATFFPGGLSAIATAFAAVVLGVGVDTGVHLYAALLDARRRGLDPRSAANAARAATWRPTLLAALAAGLAFASLALSDLSAVRQLGLMCAAGEVLTALAILLVTPEIGVWLERGAPPAPRAHGLADVVLALARTRKRAAIALAAASLPIVVLAIVGVPRPGDVLVAIRPSQLEPLVTQRDIYQRFGSREGQWLVVSEGRDLEEAASRGDRVAEKLDQLARAHVIDGYDTLTTFFPSASTQASRLRERDALDLPSKRAMLEAALQDRGFDVDACRAALESFTHPSRDVVPLDPHGPFAFIVTRHVATDARGAIAVSYVRPLGKEAEDARALETLRGAAEGTVVTGYHHLERALRDALAHDLPIVSVVALLLTIVTLRTLLRSGRDVVLALLAIAVELAWVALAMRGLHVRWHVYDALVLPVLVGITMDESMFLLFAARESHDIEAAVREQTPLVASTALTTAAGFGALLVCRFEGLRDLGIVGALGSALGLVSALVVVPAGLRLLATKKAPRGEEPAPRTP